MYFKNQFLKASQLVQERVVNPFKLSLYRDLLLAPVPTGFNICLNANNKSRVTTVSSTRRQDIS